MGGRDDRRDRGTRHDGDGILHHRNDDGDGILHHRNDDDGILQNRNDDDDGDGILYHRNTGSGRPIVVSAVQYIFLLIGQSMAKRITVGNIRVGVAEAPKSFPDRCRCSASIATAMGLNTIARIAHAAQFARASYLTGVGSPAVYSAGIKVRSGDTRRCCLDSRTGLRQFRSLDQAVNGGNHDQREDGRADQSSDHHERERPLSLRPCDWQPAHADKFYFVTTLPELLVTMCSNR